MSGIRSTWVATLDAALVGTNEQDWKAGVQMFFEQAGLKARFGNEFRHRAFHVQAITDEVIINWWPFSKSQTVYIDHRGTRRVDLPAAKHRPAERQSHTGVDGLPKLDVLIRDVMAKAGEGSNGRW